MALGYNSQLLKAVLLYLPRVIGSRLKQDIKNYYEKS